MPIDAHERSGVIVSLSQAVKESYAFPDTADRLAKMLIQHQAKGVYAAITSATEFSALLTKQMAEIAQDPHLRVVYSTDVLPPMPVPKAGQSPLQPEAQELQQMRLRQLRDNYGFRKVERLRGNIGYLKLDEFEDAAAGGERVNGAMAFLADTQAMIIDLRENRGGTPGMVQLIASYFFDGDLPVHLNDLAWRQIGRRTEDLTQWWTLSYVPGRRYLEREVYILTSHRSFSAAEEFAYDLQAQKRATLVGETTAGGANPGGSRRLSDHYWAYIPTGHAINPVTGTNWEGKGVEPDVKVPKEDALQTAYRLALQHLIKEARDEEDAGALRQVLSTLDAEAARSAR
jgi:C-terminal processing protease CtpA/Prc